MNDFSKEELELLQTALSEIDYSNPLWEKIQSMIDNYCEHEWEFYLSPNINILRCNKCNKGYDENQ
jgi:hypothetical protein